MLFDLRSKIGLYEASEDGMPKEFNVERFLADTKDEVLVQWGVETLTHCIAHLRRLENAFSGNLQGSVALIATLRRIEKGGFSVVDGFAVDYEALTAGLPIMDGSALDNRAYQYGHTSFKMCGRCEHAGSSGSDGISCSFLDYADRAPFRSPCRLRKEGVLKKAIQDLDQKDGQVIVNTKKRRDEVRDSITRVRRLKNDASSGAFLPDLRHPEKHFLFGDRVLVYAGLPLFGDLQGSWLPGTTLRSSKSEVAVILDKAYLHPNTYGTKHWINPQWGAYLWHVPVQSPFILFPQEFGVMAAPRNSRDLSEAWCERGEWGLEDPRTGSYEEIDMAECAQSIRLQKSQPEAEYGKRLMSALEAAGTLGLTLEGLTAEKVVDQYWYMFASHSMPDLLEKAKGTLLIRLQGCKEMWD